MCTMMKHLVLMKILYQILLLTLSLPASTVLFRTRTLAVQVSSQSYPPLETLSEGDELCVQ